MSQAPAVFHGVPLDRPCESCAGEDSHCHECEGTAFELTQEGEALLAFLDRHLRLDADCGD